MRFHDGTSQDLSARMARPSILKEAAVWKKLPNAFSLLLIVLLATNYFVPFADLDFTWQIRTGERIAETGGLQPVESFSYTIPGRRVPDFEWLYEVIVWGIWSVFGFGGLKLLKTILVATPFVILGLRLRKEGVGWHGIALSLLAAIFILSGSWNLRPLFCTTIGLLLVSGWLHDHCCSPGFSRVGPSEGGTPTGRRPLTWWLPVVMLAWGNLHPCVIMGQALLLGAISWEWLNRWCRINPSLERAASLRLTLVGGLGLAASCISPHPLERLLYPFRPEVAHPVQRIFAEMQPLYQTLWRPPYATLLVYLIAICVGLTIVLRLRRYRLWEVALLLALAGLANVAVRSLQDWVFIMLALGVPHLTILLKEAVKQRRLLTGASSQTSHWSLVIGHSLVLGPWSLVIRPLLRAERACKRLFNTSLLRFQWNWPAITIILLAALSLVPPLARKMPVQNRAAWPVGALDWCEAHGIEGRFFGPPDYGSYVGWRLGERGKTYVDTRGFFFPPVLLEDSHFVPQLGPEWRSRLERIFAYGTDYFLLETTGARGQLWRTLQPYIDQPLYCDEQTVLLSTAQVQRGLRCVDFAKAVSRNPPDSPGKDPPSPVWQVFGNRRITRWPAGQSGRCLERFRPVSGPGDPGSTDACPRAPP
jgi:hypothetical protein